MNVGHPRLHAASATDQATSDPLWYKDAIIYQLHIKSFFDANNDGIGDFQGLISRLDYIADLGVNTIWLLPFYPSPRLDDGYDIADYRGVHPDYGAPAFRSRVQCTGIFMSGRLTIENMQAHASFSWIPNARTGRGTTRQRRITGTASITINPI
jgi:maltose alpha-D-glucosyltransferase / alpha-amylase